VQLSPPLIAGEEQFEEIESVLRPVLSEASERVERYGKPVAPVVPGAVRG
jgi:hypothetical protein